MKCPKVGFAVDLGGGITSVAGSRHIPFHSIPFHSIHDTDADPDSTKAQFYDKGEL